MNVKMIRLSGQPVDPDLLEEYTKAWQDGFDRLTEKHGKFGPEINEALDLFEQELKDKYNDLTVATVKMPKSKKAWVAELSKYGNIIVTTCSEDGPHAKEGDLLFVVNDMVF